MSAATETLSLYPQIAFPDDPGLEDLPKLFDSGWIWRTYLRQYGRPDEYPYRIRVRQFAHSLGRVALVSYELEWRADEYIPSQHLAIRVERDKPTEMFRYPEDSRLPGLSKAAHPDTALELMNRYVLAMRARRAGVELIRYRPASRAVLRHRAGRVRFYARVMRPDAVAPLLAAQEVIGQSGFVLPRLAGYWEEGGVAWFSEVPGGNLASAHPGRKAPGPRSPTRRTPDAVERVPCAGRRQALQPGGGISASETELQA